MNNEEDSDVGPIISDAFPHSEQSFSARPLFIPLLTKEGLGEVIIRISPRTLPNLQKIVRLVDVTTPFAANAGCLCAHLIIAHNLIIQITVLTIPVG